MDRQQEIISLIKDYQAAEAEAMTWLNSKLAKDPAFHQNLEVQYGYLDDERMISYEFHGAYGCFVKWGDGRVVDFNVGRGGRVDGFDLWFVLHFYEKNNEVRSKYAGVSIDAIQAVVQELQQQGEVLYDDFTHLHYFKADYENQDPVRWNGSGNTISFDEIE